VYTAKFNFSYDLALSTRPDKFIGHEKKKKRMPLPFPRAPIRSCPFHAPRSFIRALSRLYLGSIRAQLRLY
jgi:hypothetical protein